VLRKQTHVTLKALIGLVSLSTQSLNHFEENLSKAEALSAEIASIHRGLRDGRVFPENAVSSSTEAKLSSENAGMTRL